MFDVLLIARAPLQLFQSIQTSLLPHLTGLEATEGHDAFARAIRVTVIAIAGFAGAVALGLLAIGPFAMTHLFGQHFSYGRVGLALVGIGMGLHLTSGALNQAALARDQARADRLLLGLGGEVLFLIWMLTPTVSEQLTAAHRDRICRSHRRASALMLGTLYRRTKPSQGSVPEGSLTTRPTPNQLIQGSPQFLRRLIVMDPPKQAAQ